MGNQNLNISRQSLINWYKKSALLRNGEERLPSRGWRAIRFVARLASVAAVLASLGLTNSMAEAGRPGTVYRGLHPGGMWLELGDDGNGSFALSILDGMPGFAAEPLIIPMQTDTSQGGCRLIPLEPGVSIVVQGCPAGSLMSVKISIGEVRGDTILEQVGWAGSFAWGTPSAPTNPVRQNCSMQQLRASEGLAGTVFQPALNALANEAAALPADLGDPSQTLPRLRAERLKAYAALQLTPIEAEQAKRIEDAVSGREVLGRRVPMAEATQLKREFDNRVTNSPQRIQARQTLLQVDRALAEIYDVAITRRRHEALDRLSSQTLATAFSALQQTLAARQPSRIEHLVALESTIGALDVCSATLVKGGSVQAHGAVRQSLSARASELAELVQIAIGQAADSSAARAALTPFESNQTIRDALQAGGYGNLLSSARTQITQMAQAEQRARAEEDRRAAAAEMANGGGGGDGLNLNAVASGVVNILTESGSGSGFIVAPGIVVTNVHVIEGEDKVGVLINGSKISSMKLGRVIAQYPIHDVAIVQVDGLRGPNLRIASQPPRQGSKVWALGFPGISRRFEAVESTNATLTEGIVSRPAYEGRTLQSERRGTTQLIQHTAAISPGSSGGPLFDRCERVVGINTQMTWDKSSSQVLASVSTTILPELLRQAGVTPSVSEAKC